MEFRISFPNPQIRNIKAVDGLATPSLMARGMNSHGHEISELYKKF